MRACVRMSRDKDLTFVKKIFIRERTFVQDVFLSQCDVVTCIKPSKVCFISYHVIKNYLIKERKKIF